MLSSRENIIKNFEIGIKKIFGKNLLFAFIGGSFANHIDRETSDIDTFIVTKKTIIEQEKKYYYFFKKMHKDLNRDSDHPGFIMNLGTLYNLFSILEHYSRSLKNIKSLPCVSEDCILSQYSNAKVILWFFQDTQIILKHHPLLNAFNMIMQNYKKQVLYDKMKKYRPQPTFLQSKLAPNLLKIKNQYENMVLTDSVKDTPWGINVSKFFTPTKIYLDSKTYTDEINCFYECPLSDPNLSRSIKKIVASQCIGLKLLQREITR